MRQAHGPQPSLAVVGLLLLGSGLCALVYQMVWLRELRLVFGASSHATGAVLAIFMGGLGFGALTLGRRVDRVPNPLALYAKLELLIAITAALSPAWIQVARTFYVMAGGSSALGPTIATVLRLLLSAIVLGATTFLMGGTLPAASRAVASIKDRSRRRIAALYGMNTIGGVVGVVLPTFLLFEAIGIRSTLWFAALLNLLIALLALRLSQGSVVTAQPEVDEPKIDDPSGQTFPTLYALVAATVVGSCFLLMELVWYRMLAPILGGSTYTFGLILAVVLLGIGCGSIAYLLLGRRFTPRPNLFAVTCMLEATCIAIPLALGDRIAVWAIQLEFLLPGGFAGQILNWTIITSIVTLPASIVAGFQFPLLIALLGEGRARVGRQVGLVYAWNTIGAIAGSIAGGFGLLQLLTAVGTWRAVVWTLFALGALTPLLFIKRLRKSLLFWPILYLGFAAFFLATPEGPTAVWRHTPIGAGRVEISDRTPDGFRRWQSEVKHSTLWEAEGREAGIALQSKEGLSFIINGKSDGSLRHDAPTQVMYGMVGAILHPRPDNAFVIGLGTGSSAGWLASVETIESVDVVELEPAILEVARAAEPVNRGALSNPKVDVTIGDAREVLLTSKATYDLIASEPSNPYRAGVASLFTAEFYRIAERHLTANGIFLQWVQAYEIDQMTLRTIIATLGSVFPYVETWQTSTSDLLFVCSRSPISYDARKLRDRLRQESFEAALALSWRVTTLEGFLARHIATPEFARAIAASKGIAVNRDDHPVVEFGFARSVGETRLVQIERLREASRHRRADRPDIAGEVDWSRVEDERIAMSTLEGETPEIRTDTEPGRHHRAQAQALYLQGDFLGALEAWNAQPRNPLGLIEMAMIGDILASGGSESALAFIEQFKRFNLAEADVLLGTLLWRQGHHEEAAATLSTALERYRDDPWPWPVLMRHALSVAQYLATENRSTATVLYDALSEPFSLHLLDRGRVSALLAIGKILGDEYIARARDQMAPMPRGSVLSSR